MEFSEGEVWPEAKQHEDIPSFLRHGHTPKPKAWRYPRTPEFDNFVDRCLTSDPNHRASASELMAHPFLTSASHHGDKYGALPRRAHRPIVDDGALPRRPPRSGKSSKAVHGSGFFKKMTSL